MKTTTFLSLAILAALLGTGQVVSAQSAASIYRTATSNDNGAIQLVAHSQPPAPIVTPTEAARSQSRSGLASLRNRIATGQPPLDLYGGVGGVGCDACGGGPACGCDVYGGEPSCDIGGCDAGGCGGCGSCGGMGHGFAVFGEYLFLRARDAEVPFAVAIDGPIINAARPIQVAPVAVLDQNNDMGFRGGVAYVIDDCSSLTLQYTHFETNDDGRYDTRPGRVIRSLVSHPSTINAASDWLRSAADHDITFDLMDLDYRGLLTYCDSYQINYVVGIRYAELEQEFHAAFNEQITEFVFSDVDFYGAGVKLGLEGEWYMGPCNQWLAYAKAYASLLGGESKGTYQQWDSTDPSIVDTYWESGRLAGIFELELGGGWQSQCGTYRVTAGYMFSAWTNVMKTDEWIHSVQNNNYLSLGDTMTFDGFVARAEVRF